MLSVTKFSPIAKEMPSLRVLVCAFACRPGGGLGFSGGEDLLGWNLVGQIGRFHEVWALTSAENRPAIEKALQRESLPNVQFEYLDLPRWLHFLLRLQGGHQVYTYLWQWRVYWAARRLHQQVHFHLFHHLTYANDWMASFIGALLPIPYVRGPGGGAHRTPQAFLREYPAIGRFWERVRVIGQWLFRHDPFFILGQGRASALLVCNYEAMEAIPERWRHKAVLFPVTGVSTDDLATLPSPGNEHAHFQILSVGKLIRLKGFALAIRAFELFSKKYADAGFEIIGDGPDRIHLESLVRDLELQEKVKLSRWVPHQEVLARMRASDVFLFASLRDGGGTVVVEAMAAGKPVVCLDVAGPGLHVTDECGIKVSAHSPEQAVEDMARALERLYCDPALRHRMGTAARARAEQVYHWDRLGERLLEIYQKCVVT